MFIDIKSLKAGLTELESMASRIDGEMKSAMDAITSDHLLSAEMLDEILDDLGGYTEQLSELRSNSSSVDLSWDSGMRVISCEVKELEKNQIQNRETLADYLSINTDQADLKPVLDESKKRLEMIYSCCTKAWEVDILPYKTVVRYLKAPDESMSDEEFDLVEYNISKKIARAVDLRRLRIENKEATKYRACGVIKNIKLDVSNISSESFKSDEYRAAVKEKPEIAEIMYCLAHERLCPIETVKNNDLYKYLFNNGYITILNLSQNGITRSYYILSSKGTACYSDAASLNVLNMMDRPAIVPCDICRDAAQWTAIKAARAEKINEYYRSVGKKYIIFNIPEYDSIIYAMSVSEDEEVILPAIFEEVAEQKKELEVMCEIIKNTECTVTILTLSAADRDQLLDNMKLSSKTLTRVRFYYTE